MTKEEFSQGLATLGFSQAEYARRRGRNQATVSAYANGHLHVPHGEAEHLRLMLAIKPLADMVTPTPRTRKKAGGK